MQIMPFLPSRVLWTISAPFGLLTTCLIALIWSDALSKVSVGSFSLSHLKCPFAIAVIILFALDLSTSILAGLYFPAGLLSMLSGLVLVLSQVVIGTFFLVKGYRVLRILKEGVMLVSMSSAPREKKRMQRMTNRLITSAVGMLIFCIGAAGVASGKINEVPSTGATIVVITIFGIQMTSLAQIMAIFLPRRRSRIVPSRSRDFSATPHTGTSRSHTGSSTLFPLNIQSKSMSGTGSRSRGKVSLVPS